VENPNPPHVTAHPALYGGLKLIAALHRPSTYLEVGVRDGHSLFWLLQGAGPNLRELALCDNWGGESGGSGRGGHDHIMVLLQELDYGGGRLWIDGNSHEVLLPALAGRTFDLMLVDGDHTEGGAMQDLRECLTALAPGGLLLFDDIGHPDHPYLQAVLDRFLAEHPEVELLSILRDHFCGVAVMRRKAGPAR
jgi:predicted O-methyltransferase YrrM